MDSGFSTSIMHKSNVSKKNWYKRTSANQWSAKVGSFSTSREADIKFKLPELIVTAHISAPFHVTTKKNNYDVIFGRDLLRELGIELHL